MMVPTDDNPESDSTDFILGQTFLLFLKELIVAFLLQCIPVVCLNHAVTPTTQRVFSQLFVFFLFKFFYVMFISDYISYSNNNSLSGKCFKSNFCK